MVRMFTACATRRTLSLPFLAWTLAWLGRVGGAVRGASAREREKRKGTRGVGAGADASPSPAAVGHLAPVCPLPRAQGVLSRQLATILGQRMEAPPLPPWPTGTASKPPASRAAAIFRQLSCRQPARRQAAGFRPPVMHSLKMRWTMVSTLSETRILHWARQAVPRAPFNLGPTDRRHAPPPAGRALLPSAPALAPRTPPCTHSRAPDAPFCLYPPPLGSRHPGPAQGRGRHLHVAQHAPQGAGRPPHARLRRAQRLHQGRRREDHPRLRAWCPAGASKD